LKKDKLLLDAIDITLDKIVKVISINGHLPDIDGKPDEKKRVHFCHGSPGAIPLLTEAIKLFPEKKQVLLDAALKAGEVTWR
jgi:hypothetical protein